MWRSVFRLVVMLSAIVAFASNSAAQGGADFVREVPERPVGGAGLAAAVTPPPALKGASFDLVGDSSERRDGTLSMKLGFPRVTSGLKSRLSGTVVLGAVASAVDTAGVRRSGLGDTWLRGGVVAFKEVAGGRPKIHFQYGIKAPVASDDKGLGSGYVDHRFIAAVDKTWGSVWSNFSWVTTVKGTASGTASKKVARLIGQAEIPFTIRGVASGVQTYLFVETPYNTADGSTYQQHGLLIQLFRSQIWLAGGGTVHRDAGDWTPGGYLRLEFRR